MDKKIRNSIIAAVVVVIVVVAIVLVSWKDMNTVHMDFAYNASLYLAGQNGNFSIKLDDDACQKLCEAFDGCKLQDESPFDMQKEEYTVIQFADGSARFYVPVNGQRYAYWVEEAQYIVLNDERYEMVRGVLIQYGVNLPK